MSTPKEIFLELIRPDGQPERQLRQYEALHMCLTDPCNTYLRGNRKRGSTSVDRWGTTISWPADAPGAIGANCAEDGADDFSRFLSRAGAEQRFTISAMAFQDVYSLDLERVRGCCIHVLQPDGRLVPFCLHNLTACDGARLYAGAWA